MQHFCAWVCGNTSICICVWVCVLCLCVYGGQSDAINSHNWFCGEATAPTSIAPLRASLSIPTPLSPSLATPTPRLPLSLSLWLFLNCKFLLIYFDSTFRMFYSCALGDPQNAINIFIHLNVCKPKTISANSTKFLKKEQHCKLSFIVNNLKFSAHSDRLLTI